MSPLWRRRPHILPGLLDEEVAAYLTRYMRSQGADILTGSRVKEIVGNDQGVVKGVIASDNHIPADMVLIAVGSPAEFNFPDVCPNGNQHDICRDFLIRCNHFCHIALIIALDLFHSAPGKNIDALRTHVPCQIGRHLFIEQARQDMGHHLHERLHRDLSW